MKNEEIIKILEDGIKGLEESAKELSKLKSIHYELGWEDPAVSVNETIKDLKEELAKIRERN